MSPTALSFPVLLLVCSLSFSQAVADKRVLEAYDNLVGLENTGLYNGPQFNDPFRSPDGSFRYFERFDFADGNVVYGGQSYVSVPLKYDLLEDVLVTRSNDKLSFFSIELIPGKISAFSVHGHDFVRLSNTGLALEGNGFFETAYLGNGISLYIKHKKTKKDVLIKKTVKQTFKDDGFYVVQFGGEYHEIRSVRDFRKTVPEKEKEIKKFYKSYKSLYKSNPVAFMTQLVKYLDGATKE